MRVIAQRMGVSDVWLRKCCVKAGIPVPNRGYWAKLRAGKKVVRQKLPPRPPGMPVEITVGTDPHRWVRHPEAEVAAPPPVEPTFVESIEALIDRVDRSLGKVRLTRDLGETHSLIREALNEDVLRRLKPRDAPYKIRHSDPLLESPFERRRLQVLNSLFLALTQAGHQPWLKDPQARNVGVTVGSQKVSFTLDHPEATRDANGWVQAPREANEILRLEISATADSWTDDDGGRIEKRLREIVLKLVVAGEVQYRADAHRTYEYACRRRAELQRMLVQRRAVAARLEHEKAAKADAERRQELLKMAADHRTAQDIRAFVSAAAGALDPDSAAHWVTWALEVASQIDPVSRLQIADDGTVEARPASLPAACLRSDS